MGLAGSETDRWSQGFGSETDPSGWFSVRLRTESLFFDLGYLNGDVARRAYPEPSLATCLDDDLT